MLSNTIDCSLIHPAVHEIEVSQSPNIVYKKYDFKIIINEIKSSY